MSSRKILDALPKSIRKRVERLSEKTGDTPLAIVAGGVKFYELNADLTGKIKEAAGVDGEDGARLLKLVPDPEKRAIYKGVMRVLSIDANSVLTTEQKALRNSKGGTARAKKISDKLKQKIASAGGRAKARNRYLRAGLPVPEHLVD